MGIIVTTVILMISFHQNGNKKMKDEDVIARAKQLGMVMKDEASSSGNAKGTSNGYLPMDDLIGDAGKEAETSKKDEKEPDKKKEPAKTESTEKEPEEKLKEEQKPENVTIKIKSGDFSENVSQRLKEAGLIADAGDFNEYLKQNGYAGYIMPGEYSIPTDATKREIARILTGKNP